MAEAVVGAHPKGTVLSVFDDTGNKVMGQACSVKGVVLIKNIIVAIVSDQPIERGKPNESPAILLDIQNGVRQAPFPKGGGGNNRFLAEARNKE